MDPVKISSTGLSAFRACPAKYRWRYVDRLSPMVRPSYQIFGDVVHRLIAARRLGIPPQMPDDAHIADVITCEELAEAYADYWGESPDKYWCAESHFFVRVGRHVLHGVFDAINCYKQLVENKTTSGAVDITATALIDPQLMVYSYAIWKLGLSCDKIIYSVIKKPRIKRKDGEDDSAWRARVREHIRGRMEELFCRYEFPLILPDVAEAELEKQVKALVYSMKHSLWFKNPSFYCKYCEYSGPCLSGRDVKDCAEYYFRGENDESANATRGEEIADRQNSQEGGTIGSAVWYGWSRKNYLVLRRTTANCIL